jgi:phospholipase/carboxylesterase
MHVFPRAVIVRAALLVIAFGLVGCNPLDVFGDNFSGDPRLDVMWAAPREDTLAIGQTTLPFDDPHAKGVVYVPASYDAEAPTGLLLVLHGGGGTGANYANAFKALADSNDFIVLAPDSKQLTWDLVSTGKVGVDVERLSTAIEYVLRRATIDPARIWIVGHSDGATYALTIGAANGDHFRRVISFAPGFLYAPQKNGRPPLRVVHGRFDPVFTLAETEREVVGPMRAAGYEVTLVPFDGGHEMPQAQVDAAIAWLTGIGESIAQGSAQVHAHFERGLVRR